MKVKELLQIIEGYTKRQPQNLDRIVAIRIAKPSMGSLASEKVESISFGIDWDSNTCLINPGNHLVPKTEKEEIYDLAFDLLYFLGSEKSTRTGKLKNGWANQRARRIFERAGRLIDWSKT